MHRGVLLTAVLTVSLATLAHAGTAWAAAPATSAAIVSPAPPEHLDTTVFHCGPILAKDTATRERIQSLYRQQFDLQQSTLAQLREIRDRSQRETDQDALAALTRQGGQLKQDLLRRNMELGLEIARLNGDSQRAAEFAKALDQLLHPERYQAAPAPNPEAQARRARELAK
jgi:Spy/CpxP family protein refolding chaperone